MYQNILVPVDGSAISDLGVQEATKLARLTGASVPSRGLETFRAVRARLGCRNASAPTRAQGARRFLGRRRGPWLPGRSLNIERYLRVHGVSATFHRESAAGDAIGELMLSKAADVGADLLVMGCYAHSRVRELVLGGATSVVLRSMTVPVLMSH